MGAWYGAYWTGPTNKKKNTKQMDWMKEEKVKCAGHGRGERMVAIDCRVVALELIQKIWQNLSKNERHFCMKATWEVWQRIFRACLVPGGCRPRISSYESFITATDTASLLHTTTFLFLDNQIFLIFICIPPLVFLVLWFMVLMFFKKKNAPLPHLLYWSITLT